MVRRKSHTRRVATRTTLPCIPAARQHSQPEWTSIRALQHLAWSTARLATEAMDPAHRRRRLRHPLATCPRSGAPALQASASARSARKRSTCSWAQSTSRISRSSLVSARLIAAAETASRFADAIFLAPLAPPIHQRVASNDRRPHLPARNQVSSYLEQGVRTRRLGHGSAQRDQRGTRHREPRVGAHLPGTVS